MCVIEKRTFELKSIEGTESTLQSTKALCRNYLGKSLTIQEIIYDRLPLCQVRELQCDNEFNTMHRSPNRLQFFKRTLPSCICRRRPENFYLYIKVTHKSTYMISRYKRQKDSKTSTVQIQWNFVEHRSLTLQHFVRGP